MRDLFRALGGTNFIGRDLGLHPFPTGNRKLDANSTRLGR